MSQIVAHAGGGGAAPGPDPGPILDHHHTPNRGLGPGLGPIAAALATLPIIDELLLLLHTDLTPINTSLELIPQLALYI